MLNNASNSFYRKGVRKCLFNQIMAKNDNIIGEGLGGEINSISHLTLLRKPEMSVILMGHLARLKGESYRLFFH